MVAPGASWMAIGELSRRIGVSTDLLRKWEHRYAVLSPERTSGNQRLYSQVDEARARLMLRHVRAGMSPAQAAELATAARFRIKPDPAVTAPATADRTAHARVTMQTALEHYDETTAEQALERLLTMLPATSVIRDVLLPYLRDIGERWAGAHLTVAQEHFASNFIHSRLLGVARGWDRGLGPRAVLACPPGEQHTFGLIAFGIALHQIGWRITYLGADTPIPMIAQASISIRPRLTVIAAAVPGPLERVLPELSHLSARQTLAIAGTGATRQLAARCAAVYLADDPVTAADAFLHDLTPPRA